MKTKSPTQASLSPQFLYPAAYLAFLFGQLVVVPVYRAQNVTLKLSHHRLVPVSLPSFPHLSKWDHHLSHPNNLGISLIPLFSPVSASF